MNVKHLDMFYKFFPYTIENKDSTWYSNLPSSSIWSSNYFENMFISNFVDEKTPTTLFKELIAINMEKKEKVKDFNQYFTTLPTY